MDTIGQKSENSLLAPELDCGIEVFWTDNNIPCPRTVERSLFHLPRVNDHYGPEHDTDCDDMWTDRSRGYSSAMNRDQKRDQITIRYINI